MNHSTAVISKDGVYRYHLQRIWDENKPRIAFCMLNGSTADGDTNDPTIRRCIGFGQSWGFGGLEVVNEYGLRSTNPAQLWKHPDPIGPDNDDWILKVASDSEVGMFVCAWGKLGLVNRRDVDVRKILSSTCRDIFQVGVYAFPRHPLYLKADLQPIKI